MFIELIKIQLSQEKELIHLCFPVPTSPKVMLKQPCTEKNF